MLTEFGNSTRKWPEILSPNKLIRFSKKGTRFPKINNKRDKGRRQKKKKLVLLGGAHHKVATPPSPPVVVKVPIFFVENFFMLRIP